MEAKNSNSIYRLQPKFLVKEEQKAQEENREPIIIPHFSNSGDNGSCKHLHSDGYMCQSYGGNCLKLLRFRIFHSESLNGNRLHYLIFQGSVVITGRCLRNTVHHIHPLYHLPKRRILAVQMGLVLCIIKN